MHFIYFAARKLCCAIDVSEGTSHVSGGKLYKRVFKRFACTIHRKDHAWFAMVCTKCTQHPECGRSQADTCA